MEYTERKNRYDIFLCYGRQDSEAVLQITNILESNGYTYFADVKSISAGEDFAESISNAIQSCSLFLFVHSKNSAESRWCEREVVFAVKHKKPIIPINIDGTPLTDVFAFMLSAYSFIEFRISNFEGTLLSRIRDILGTSSMTPLTQEQRDLNIAAAKNRHNGADNYIPQTIDVDIFISYRRVDGRDYARNIMQALKIMGYQKVFFDYNSIRDGVFNTQILDAIYSCNDFILVISPLALKNCSRKGDWVTKEIREALKYNKKIIPIVIEDTFKDWPTDFPDDLSPIKSIQFHKLLTDEYFEESIEKLTKRLDTTASNNFASLQELRSIEPVKKEIVYYKVKVNKNCRVYIDDEEIQLISANRLSKIPLPKGEYIRKVVDVKYNQVFDEATLVLHQDKAEVISLKTSFWQLISSIFYK